MILPNKRETWLDDLTGNSADCLTDLTVTCGLGMVLCLRRSSLADNTGSSSLSAAAAVAAEVWDALTGAVWVRPVRHSQTGVLLWLIPVRDAPTGVFWLIPSLPNADAAVAACDDGVDVNDGGVAGCEGMDSVTMGLDADIDDDWVLTSDVELDWTVADGKGWATPAQTTDVGVTLLATVDNEAGITPGNTAAGGMKGNIPAGPGTRGGTPRLFGGKKGGGIWPKNGGIIGDMNGIRPAAYAGCIGMNGDINGDRQGICGMADVDELAALLIIIRGSNGGGKKSGFGKDGNWAGDDTEVAAAAPALAVAAEVDEESASDADADGSLVVGFSFSPCNNHIKHSSLISTDEQQTAIFYQ